jgi:hypothetical protein
MSGVEAKPDLDKLARRHGFELGGRWFFSEDVCRRVDEKHAERVAELEEQIAELVAELGKRLVLAEKEEAAA